MQSKFRIAVLGTRGIPNQYGGFEQCAEKVSLYFQRNGHSVTVYNPSEHPYKHGEWNGIRIKHIFSDEKKLKFLNTFVFDYLSLKDAVKNDFDIILELGYSPCSLFYYLKGKTKIKIVTNMDGLDWKRSKWNKLARSILKYSEKIAVEKSDALIADNPGIKEYLLKKFQKESYYIPYGAELCKSPNEDYLKKYDIQKFAYYLLIARLEPENNIETILDGYVLSQRKEPFIVIGKYATKYGHWLRKKYSGVPGICFLGSIYDYDLISSMRWYSRLYFHGHSVGGTNPSLVEAMASGSYIVAHNNRFNKAVLEDDALYFENEENICSIINSYDDTLRNKFINNNRERVMNKYNWENVSEEYLKVFKDMLKIS